MATKKAEVEKKEETAVLVARYEKDSKRFNRYQIEENSEGIVGTLYQPKEKFIKEIILKFEK
jgi:hypothetical protein